MNTIIFDEVCKAPPELIFDFFASFVPLGDSYEGRDSGVGELLCEPRGLTDGVAETPQREPCRVFAQRSAQQGQQSIQDAVSVPLAQRRRAEDVLECATRRRGKRVAAQPEFEHTHEIAHERRAVCAEDALVAMHAAAHVSAHADGEAHDVAARVHGIQFTERFAIFF